MNPLVVDASVVLKWYFTEAHADLALKVVNYPGGIIVPESLESQVGMALWRRVRANELRKDDAHRVLANLRRLPLQRVPTQSLAPAALEIASVTSRTFMESLYFALAIREQTRLVTADRWWFALLQTGPMKPHLRWIGDVARELEGASVTPKAL
ncbi:MAG: type II toxin-antitoxin system VapC family toxin [Fimbriimonas sp.]